MKIGPYNFAFSHLNDFVFALRDKETNPRRAAFAALCSRVALAMRDIEQTDAGRAAPESENPAIDDACGVAAYAAHIEKLMDEMDEIKAKQETLKETT